MVWDLANRVEVDEWVVKEAQKVSQENRMCFDKDLQTLNGSRQTTCICELQEAVDANDNIIETQQESQGA